MTAPRKWVSVLYFPGTNCEEETMAAVRLAGGDPHLVYEADLLSGKTEITDCDNLCVAGGFSYGDFIATGKVAATVASEYLQELRESGIPTIGICNGFQVLARAGFFGRVTLGPNDSGVFCSRPVQHRVLPSVCVWTKGLEDRVLTFPSAHGWGKVISQKPINTVLTYASKSPNGGTVAGICTRDGLTFGLMDHPERPYGNLDGLAIFRNGLRAA